MTVCSRIGDGHRTTILYEARGREVWRLAEAKDWTGVAEAAKLLAEAATR